MDEMQHKSSVDEIRTRFDNDVERFSNLETGQSATIDAAIALDLVARAAVATTPHAKRLLDIGCGAGNFSLRTLAEGHFDAASRWWTLAATCWIAPCSGSTEKHDIQIETQQIDIRELELPNQKFDIVVAGRGAASPAP